MNRAVTVVIGHCLVAAVALAEVSQPTGKKQRRWDSALGPDPIPEYEVVVDGRKIDLLPVQMKFCEGGAQPIRDWGGVYWAASFPYRPGAIVCVKSLTVPLDEAVLTPKGRIREMKRSGDYEISFSSPRPFRTVLEREKRVKPLMLFGNAAETDTPDFSGPNIIRFGPGKHKVDKVMLTDNQTLYLDYGAILYGGVMAKGTNITVRGHGVISGAVYPRMRGPCGHPLSGRHCRGLTVRDITITASWSWTFVLHGCDGVTVDNIRILGSRMINDDAIDIVNSRNVTIRNSFVRAQDDLFALKGHDREKNTPVDGILIEECDLWCDRANIFRVGYESDASGMGNITGRNLEILHVSSEHAPFESAWPHALFWLQPSGGLRQGDMTFENIKVNLDGYDTHLVIANPRVLPWGRPRYTTGGSISNVVFRNISVSGCGLSHCPSVLQGRNESETVSDIRFENVRIFGKTLTASSPDVRIGEFASGISFASPQGKARK